nr:hypothetical protein [Cytophagales bacterium]
MLADCISGQRSFLHAELRGVNLCGVDLLEANLNGANFCDAYLSEPDLSERSIREAKFINAIACGATFFRADLREVYIRLADLRYTNIGKECLSRVGLSQSEPVQCESWRS